MEKDFLEASNCLNAEKAGTWELKAFITQWKACVVESGVKFHPTVLYGVVLGTLGCYKRI